MISYSIYCGQLETAYEASFYVHIMLWTKHNHHCLLSIETAMKNVNLIVGLLSPYQRSFHKVIVKNFKNNNWISLTNVSMPNMLTCQLNANLSQSRQYGNYYLLCVNMLFLSTLTRFGFVKHKAFFRLWRAWRFSDSLSSLLSCEMAQVQPTITFSSCPLCLHIDKCHLTGMPR